MGVGFWSPALFFTYHFPPIKMEVVHRSNLVPFFFQGSTCFWKRFSQKKKTIGCQGTAGEKIQLSYLPFLKFSFSSFSQIAKENESQNRSFCCCIAKSVWLIVLLFDDFVPFPSVFCISVMLIRWRATLQRESALSFFTSSISTK